MKTLIDLYNIGMARNYSDIIPSVEGTVLNLGAGNKHIPGAISLDYPDWNAEVDPIPFGNESVDMIHCYHFLEHIENVMFAINEINRVLKIGAHANIVVPYYNSHLHASDLDHKHAFTERTFEKILRDSYYSKDKISGLEVVTNFIMADCEANISLMIQIRKI